MRRFALAALLAAACAGPASLPEPATARSEGGPRIAFDASGSGEPSLVFVHGWCGSRREWRAVADLLAPRFRVVALDLSGHGESGDEREDWTLDALAGDVVALLETLELERAVLVGHSLGGPVCLLAAARAPERVLGVIGVETLHQVDAVDPPGLAEPLAAALRRDRRGALERYVGAALPIEADPALHEALVEAALEADLDASIALLHAYSSFDARPALAACPVPVRCINSARPIETDAVAARRYAPSFAVVLLERTGHFPMVEAPGELAARIAAAAFELDARSSER